jgi:hypothetical protein
LLLLLYWWWLLLLLRWRLLGYFGSGTPRIPPLLLIFRGKKCAAPIVVLI